MGYIEELMGKNEQILMRTRRHWMAIATQMIGYLFTAALIVVLTLLATGLLAPFIGPLAAFVPLAFLLLIFPAWGALSGYLHWWNEEYLVTNRRVVQSEGVINKHVIDSSLEKVNDVVLNQSFFGRVFDYGDIEIMTASEIGVNRLDRITSPVAFKTAMLNAKEAMGSDEHVHHASDGAPDIPSLIANLDELRKQGVLTEAEFEQKKAQLLAKI